MNRKYILWIEVIIIGILILILAGTLMRDPAFFALQTLDEGLTHDEKPGTAGDQTELTQLLSKGIVQVLSGDYLGSGVVIDMTQESIILISAKHLLQNAAEATVVFSFGDGTTQEQTGTIIALSSQYDIGFLSVPIAELGEERASELYCCEMKEEAFAKLKNGAAVIQIGSTDGAAADVYTGTVTNKWLFVGDFNSFMIQTDSFAKAGMSGGAVFNQEGDLIGIINGGDSANTVCMPVNLVLEEYERLSSSF